MKLLLLISLLVANSHVLIAQTLPDSILEKYHAGKTLQDKADSLGGYLKLFQDNDSLYTQNILGMLAYFHNQNDETGILISQIFLGKQFAWRQDYNTALNHFLQALATLKKRNDTTTIMNLHFDIGYAYENTKNYLDAVKYFKGNYLMAHATGKKADIGQACNMIGTLYAEAFMPDSGLVYALEGLNIGYELKNDVFLVYILATVAENYIAKGEYDLALSYMRKSQQHHAKTNQDEYSINYPYSYNAYAQAYLGMKQYDSTLYYAHQSLSHSIPRNFLTQQLRSYEYLYKSYDALNRPDSAFKYFRLAAALKDSIAGTEKVKAIEATNFREVLRQQQLEAEMKASAEQQRLDIQYALMAAGIVTFIILFFLLSQSIIVNERVISFLGILGLLIVFEFINLLIHPYLEKRTNHSPLLMLGVLVLVASLLIPLHHRIEKWIKEKMTEKNKRIRLAAAKRIIERLEGESNSEKDGIL